MECVELNPTDSLVINEIIKPQWHVMYKLFINVENMPEIYENLLKGNIQAVLLKPSMVSYFRSI